MSGKTEELAALLLAARRSGRRIDKLPDRLLPATDAEAYAVQEATAAQLGRIAGWKVGAAAPDAEPNCAPLFADLVAPSPARFSAARFPLHGIEGELAFRLGADLPPRAAPYGEEEVLDACATLHAAIELVESRFVDFRAMDKRALLADNQNNGAFCYGAPLDDWRAVDFLRAKASLLVDGSEVASAIGGNAAGPPGRLLAWLANHCARRGRGLRAGDIITTGSHTGLVFPAPGASITARFDGVGACSLALDP